MSIFRPWLGSAALVLTVALAAADENPTDFASAGLKNGSIKGQGAWSVSTQAPANGDFVITPGGLEVTENMGGSHAPAYAYFYDNDSPAGRDNFPAGMPTTETVDFTLKQTAGSYKGRILGLGWGLFKPVGPNCVHFFAEILRDTEAGGYQLRLSLSEKTKAEGQTSVLIPEEALGLSAAKAESDPLQISLTLNNQGEPADWETVTILTNLKTQKSFVLKNTLNAPEVYKTQDLIRSLINLRRAGEDGLSAVLISQIDAAPALDPSAQ